MVISLRLNEPEPERPLTEDELKDRAAIEAFYKRCGGERVVLTPEEPAEYRRYLACKTGEPRD